MAVSMRVYIKAITNLQDNSIKKELGLTQRDAMLKLYDAIAATLISKMLTWSTSRLSVRSRMLFLSQRLRRSFLNRSTRLFALHLKRKPLSSLIALYLSSVANSVCCIISNLTSYYARQYRSVLEYALNSTAVIYLLNNTYSVIRHKYVRKKKDD